MSEKKTPKRILVNVDPETHKEAKVKAAESGLSLSEVIRALLLGWLGKPIDKPQQK